MSLDTTNVKHTEKSSTFFSINARQLMHLEMNLKSIDLKENTIKDFITSNQKILHKRFQKKVSLSDYYMSKLYGIKKKKPSDYEISEETCKAIGEVDKNDVLNQIWRNGSGDLKRRQEPSGPVLSRPPTVVRTLSYDPLITQQNLRSALQPVRVSTAISSSKNSKSKYKSSLSYFSSRFVPKKDIDPQTISPSRIDSTSLFDRSYKSICFDKENPDVELKDFSKTDGKWALKRKYFVDTNKQKMTNANYIEKTHKLCDEMTKYNLRKENHVPDYHLQCLEDVTLKAKHNKAKIIELDEPSPEELLRYRGNIHSPCSTWKTVNFY